MDEFDRNQGTPMLQNAHATIESSCCNDRYLEWRQWRGLRLKISLAIYGVQPPNFDQWKGYDDPRDARCSFEGVIPDHSPKAFGVARPRQTGTKTRTCCRGEKAEVLHRDMPR